MGIFNRDKDDNNVKRFNEEIVDNKVSKQLDQLDNTLSGMWSDMKHEPSKFFDGIYQHSTASLVPDTLFDVCMNAADSLGSILTDVGLPSNSFNPFNLQNVFNSKEGKFSLYNYKTPTDQQYMHCNEVKGLSVWDIKGWWHCLFPESVIRQNASPGEDISQYLTKEKVENDHSHKYGLFFNDYTGYLSWRSHMMKLIKDKKLREEKERDDLCVLPVSANTPEELMSWDQTRAPADTPAASRVVGSSSYSTLHSTDTCREEMTETKTYFDDGTVSIQSEKKIIPFDGSEPIHETVKKIIDKKEDRPHGGWFWKK